MPILDNAFGSGVGFSAGPRPERPYTAEEVVEIIKTVFIAAGERDIMIGDGVDIFVLRKGGELRHEIFELKKD